MKKHLSFGFLILVLMMPAIAHIPNLAQEKGTVVIALYTLFSLLFLVLPLAIVRPVVFGYISIPFLILVPFELIHILNYDGYTTLAAFTSSMETNYNEATEFVHSYRHYLYLSYPVVVASIAAFFINVKRSYKLNVLAKTVIAIGFTAVIALFTVKNVYDLYARGDKHITHNLNSMYSRLLNQSYPYSYLLKAYKYTVQHNALMKSLEAKKDFLFGASFDSDTVKQTKPVVVLVIGETSRANNWQLSGYHRETNPKLMKRDNLFYYSNTISAATHTSQTIQLVLSRATPRNLDPVYTEKSIVSAFGEAGYKTVWISNQNMTGGVETAIFSVAKEADERIYSGGDYRISSEFDEVLIPALEKTLKKHAEEPLFIIIHTMGSHEVYRKRYPPDYEVFKPASKGDDYNFSSPGVKERILNSYDNSILYTDYILDSIIEALEKENRVSSVTFFSDHGENLLDDDENRFGHGGVIPTRYVTDVPMFIWTSRKFQEAHIDMYRNLNSNIKSPVSNLYLFDTLVDIGGINIKGYINKFSLANDSFGSASYERYILNTSYKPLKYNDIKFSTNKVADYD